MFDPSFNAFTVIVYTMTNRLLRIVIKINQKLLYSGSAFVAFVAIGKNVAFAQKLFPS
jgi:hypothetical protein